MADPIIPFSVWASGTNQNSIPANDNSLRNEILNGLVISKSVTAQPSSPSNGDIYILAATHTGSQWSTFDPDDLVIYKDGTWYEFAPSQGVVVNFEGHQEQYTGSSGWENITVPGGGFDMFSTLTAAEISVTGATTATIGRMHVCSGTSADYTLTLPASSGNAGRFLGVRISGACTRWITIDGNSSELIDGALTRRMWQNETAVLMCDGTGWTKVSGKSIGMSCILNRTTGMATVSIPASTFTAVPVTNLIMDNTSTMATTMADTVNGRARTLRPGRYSCSGMVSLTAPSGTTLAGLVVKDSATPDGAPSLLNNTYIGAIGVGQSNAAGIHDVTVNGYITLSAFQDNASARPTRNDFIGVVPCLSITELPSW